MSLLLSYVLIVTCTAKSGRYRETCIWTRKILLSPLTEHIHFLSTFEVRSPWKRWNWHSLTSTIFPFETLQTNPAVLRARNWVSILRVCGTRLHQWHQLCREIEKSTILFRWNWLLQISEAKKILFFAEGERKWRPVILINDLFSEQPKKGGWVDVGVLAEVSTVEHFLYKNINSVSQRKTSWY